MTEKGPEPSCADWLEVLRPHLHRGLIDPRRLEPLRALWRRFPGDGLVAIEVRLGERARRVDCALELASPGMARSIDGRLLCAHHRWFLRRWGRDPRLAYASAVSAVWLEFDFEGSPETPGAPLLCARLRGRPDPDWLVSWLVPALRGGPLRPKQARLLRRMVAAVPSDGRVLYAFDLGPRRATAVRTELYGLEPARMVEYLETTVSREVAGRVARLSHLIAGADRYHVALDVTEEVLPRIGIECGWRGLPHRESGWRRVLDRWVKAGLASAAKRDALLAWPGYDSLWSAPTRWPESAVGRGGHLVRCLSHLKLVSGLEGAPEAKAYLLFRHLPPPGQDERPEGASRLSSSAFASASRM